MRTSKPEIKFSFKPTASPLVTSSYVSYPNQVVNSSQIYRPSQVSQSPQIVLPPTTINTTYIQPQIRPVYNQGFAPRQITFNGATSYTLPSKPVLIQSKTEFKTEQKPPKYASSAFVDDIPNKKEDDFAPGCCSCFSPMTYGAKK